MSITLTSGVPVKVTPQKTDVAYNPMTSGTMDGTDCTPVRTCCEGKNATNTLGNLYVSDHGDVHQSWLTVIPGNYVRFDKPLYFMQKSGATVEVPLYPIP